MIDWAEFSRCQHWLQDAIELNDGEQTLKEVAFGLFTGKYRLWPGRTSAVVTEHTETPAGKFLNLMLAGGELDDLVEVTARIEEWGKENGVTRILLYGRRGWARNKTLKERGYRTRHVIMAKDL